MSRVSDFFHSLLLRPILSSQELLSSHGRLDFVELTFILKQFKLRTITGCYSFIC